MAKKIEDYLHLYLGCRCKENIGGRIWVLNTVHENLGVRLTPDMRRKDVCIRMYCNQFKPILRPLSSMTKLEEVEVGELMSGGTDGVHQVWIYTHSPESFRWQLNKGFDLFGLIDAGLAIDSTTLNHKDNGSKSTNPLP